MSTELNPQAVREIALDALTNAVRNNRDLAINGAIMRHGGLGPITSGTFAAHHWAAVDEYDRLAAALMQPDEQPQDERDGDVRAVRALTTATNRMLGRWAEADEAVRRELWTEVHDRADDAFDRYRERFAELDAREAKASER